MNAKASVPENHSQVAAPSAKDFAKLSKLIEKAVEKFDGTDTPESLTQKVLAELDEAQVDLFARHLFTGDVHSKVEAGLRAKRVQARQLHFDGLGQLELLKDGAYSHQGSKIKIGGKFVHAVGATPEQWRAKAEMFATKLDARAAKKAQECRLYADLLAANHCSSIAELSSKKKLVLVSPTPTAKSAGA